MTTASTSLLREQFVIVRIRGDAVVRLAGLARVVLVHELLGVLCAIGVEVAHGHDLRERRVATGRGDRARANASGADRPDVDAVARGAAPKTDAGTIDGNPATTEAAARPLPAVARNRGESPLLHDCHLIELRARGHPRLAARAAPRAFAAPPRAGLTRPLRDGSERRRGLLERHPLRLLLRLQHQFGREIAVRLRHRRLRPIQDVVTRSVRRMAARPRSSRRTASPSGRRGTDDSRPAGPRCPRSCESR